MNCLQQLMIRCFQLSEENSTVPQHMLADLGKNVLTLSDVHLQHAEVSAICKFLMSKNASKHLEGLVLNKSHGKTRRTRRLAATRAGSHSGFQLEGGRILKSVASFLVNSHAIQTLEIDNVAINLSMVQALGQSFSERQEALNLGFQHISFRNVPLGDEGLRSLAPHLGKCYVQCLSFQCCNLSDASLPYLSSIIKAQEGIQDKCYWNSTLRTYPDCDWKEPDNHPKQQVYSDGISNTGLLLLDLSGNKYSLTGSQGILKIIRSNQWLLGINLSDNCINSDGIYGILEHFQMSDSTSALLCMPLRGNPGCSVETLRGLSDIALQSMVHPVLANLPDHCASRLIEWLRLQEDTSPPRPRRTTKSKKTSIQQKRQSNSNEYRYAHHSNNHEKANALHSTFNEVKLEDEEFLPSGQNYVPDPDFEGFVPPSPAQGIDGRPPSRNSIRPHHSNDPLLISDVCGSGGRKVPPVEANVVSRSKRLSNKKKRPDSSFSLGRFTNPYDNARLAYAVRRSSSASTQSIGRRVSCRQSSRDFSPREKQLTQSDRPPFRPSSGNAPLNSYEKKSKSRSSSLVGHSDNPVAAPESVYETYRRAAEKRRKQSIRHRSSRKRSVPRSQVDALSIQKSGEKIAEEIGKSFMNDLAKLVNSVSTDLQNVSVQLKSLTESMSESVAVLNSSRDNTFFGNESHRGDHSMEHRSKHFEHSGDVFPNGISDVLCSDDLREEDVNLNQLIKEGLRDKLINVIHTMISDS